MTTPLELDDIGSLFADLQQQLRDIDYEPVMIASMEMIAEGERAVFDAGESPGGERWAPNAPSTIRKKGHGIVLFETGALERSLVQVGADHNIHETSHRGLLFGSDLPYSIFNQKGTSRIPARPHAGMSENLVNAICEEVAEFTVASLRE